MRRFEEGEKGVLVRRLLSRFKHLYRRPGDVWVSICAVMHEGREYTAVAEAGQGGGVGG